MSERNANILARWQTSLENAVCSPLEFYELVENALREAEIPNLQFSNVVRNEGGWFSSRRIYLRIRYQRLYFDVSAFVVGNFLTISWWLHEDAPGVADLFSEIPMFDFLLRNTTRAETYYQVDYIEHFQHTFHDSVLRIVDELRKENALPILTGEERTPIWEEVW
jgi:hypothetical protein